MGKTRAVLDHLGIQVADVQRSAAFYDAVRDRFLLFDEADADLFRPVADRLVADGVCAFNEFTTPRGHRVVQFDLAEVIAAGGPPPPPPDSDSFLRHAGTAASPNNRAANGTRAERRSIGRASSG